MDTVFLRNAATGQLANAEPVELRRIPVKGDFIVASDRRLYTVVRVIHDWDGGNLPVVLCDVAPAEVALAKHDRGAGPAIE